MIVIASLGSGGLGIRMESSCFKILQHKVGLEPRIQVFNELKVPIFDAIWAACKIEQGEHMNMKKKVREK